MKKLILITLILLPMVAMAQTTGTNTVATKTVKEFFDKYSEFSGYEYLEVNELMFKQFLETEDLEKEMVDFLSNLKFIRYLERKGSSRVSFAGSVAGVGTRDGRTAEKDRRGGNIYFVDGVRIRGSINVPKNAKAQDSVKVVDGSKSKKVAATSVISTGSAAANVSASNRQSSIDSNPNLLYNNAKTQINLDLFSQLMKANQNGERMIFLKRPAGGGFSEYLLINGNTMINIMGKLDINHINQIEEILEAVGEILPM